MSPITAYKTRRRIITVAVVLGVLALLSAPVVMAPDAFLDIAIRNGSTTNTQSVMNFALHFYTMFGADVNKVHVAENGERYTLLDKAVDMEDTKMLRVLLDFGANPNVSAVGNGNTLIMGACYTNPKSGEEEWQIKRQMTRLLLAHGADPYHKMNDGRSAFDIAKDPEIIRLLKTTPRK